MYPVRSPLCKCGASYGEFRALRPPCVSVLQYSLLQIFALHVFRCVVLGVGLTHSYQLIVALAPKPSPICKDSHALFVPILGMQLSLPQPHPHPAKIRVACTRTMFCIAGSSWG